MVLLLIGPIGPIYLKYFFFVTLYVFTAHIYFTFVGVLCPIRICICVVFFLSDQVCQEYLLSGPCFQCLFCMCV